MVILIMTYALYRVCSVNIIMMPEFVYITVTFNTLLLTKGLSSSVPP